MPSDDELASTIEELARKLDDASEEEIHEELQRYLDHGVPLHQAKKDIEQSLSTSTSSGGTASPGQPVDKTVDEITTSDESVNLTAKILSVDEREITARGEQKTIWSGMLGDATGAVAYTAWRDVGLEEGAVVRIENAYVTEWRDDPQVNIGDYAEVEATDENIEVPDQDVKTRGRTDAGEQDIADLEDGMGSVSVEGRVLSKSAREVTIQGEETTLWEGQIADASGKIPYTAWHDHGFAEGDVIRIENGYVRSFRGVPQLNFGENADVTELDDDAAPPASELVDVEGPEMATQARDIGDLESGMSSVDVTGRVLSISQRTIQSDDEDRHLWEGQIADASGKIPYTAWEEPSFDEGDVIRIENAYVRSFRGVPQLNFGDNASIGLQDDDAVPSAGELADVEGPSMSTEKRSVEELAPGMSSVEVTGRVLTMSQRTIQSNGEERQLWEGELADDTGRIPYTAWEEPSFAEDDVIRIENAYVRAFRGLPQLNFGDNAKVTEQPDDAVGPASELAKTREAAIAELQAAKGAVGVHVEAVAIEIRDGSGLIMRCPECRRLLELGECRMHGRVDGVPDLRVKAVVDDGSGAVTAILDRSMTEQLLGKSLAECQEEAEEAKTRDIIEDEVKELLLMKRVAIDGNATHDDYGTTLVVNDVTVLEHDDIEAAADALIEQVDALAQEVQEVTA